MKKLILILAVAALPMAALAADATTPPAKKKTHKAHTTASPAPAASPSPAASPAPKASPSPAAK